MDIKKRVEISASILSADFAQLGKDIQAVTKAGADFIHIDVMDGMFVPNITMGPKIIADIRQYSDLPFDTHLMIQEPQRYIEAFAKAGSDLITVHLEATSDIEGAIKMIRSFNKKVGLSIVPSTPAQHLETWYDKIDLILVMTVNPGFAGQSFIHSQLEKIREIHTKRTNTNMKIFVDGGIDEQTAHLVKQAGADVLVAGSAIFYQGVNYYKDNIQKLRLA